MHPLAFGRQKSEEHEHVVYGYRVQDRQRRTASLSLTGHPRRGDDNIPVPYVTILAALQINRPR